MIDELENPLDYNFSAFELGGIYSVACPITNNIIYVGKTIDLESRRIAHIRGYGIGEIGVYERWILNNGKKPIFEVLEYIFVPFIGSRQRRLHQTEYMNSIEVYWIYQMRSWGFNLLNKDFMKLVKYRTNYFNYQYASKTNT